MILATEPSAFVLPLASVRCIQAVSVVAVQGTGAPFSLVTSATPAVPAAGPTTKDVVRSEICGTGSMIDTPVDVPPPPQELENAQTNDKAILAQRIFRWRAMKA